MALQEIGPRFTLKLRSLKKGIPSVTNYGEAAKPLEIDSNAGFEDSTEMAASEKAAAEEAAEEDADRSPEPPKKTIPPKQDEVLWMWKPELEVSRKTFFL